MTALPPDVVANLKQENARLQVELRATRERQAASAEILRAIASTSGDAERSLRQIAETTARLFDCQSVRIRTVENGEWGRTIGVGASAERVGAEVSAAQLRIGGKSLPATVLYENRQIHIPDLFNVDPAMADWPGLPPARATGTRVIAGTPLRCEGKAIGVLIVYRDRPEPFTAEELALQQSFADQAVIAIENARLFNETKEALERQTATADILRVIASSPSDVQPVFEAIAATANRLIGGHSTAVLRFIGDGLHLAAFTPTNPVADETLKASFPRPLVEFPPFVLVHDGATVQFTDTESEDVPQLNRELARLRGYRSMLFTPLMSGGTPIGLISVTRKEPGNFAAHHVQLVRTFADQAVIAIENVRLFDEVQARTRDLTEALEQQTATSEVLKVISSSPGELEPVFNSMLENAVSICDAKFGNLFLIDGDSAHWEAGVGTPPKLAQYFAQSRSFRPTPGSHLDRVMRTKQVSHTADDTAEAVVGASARLGGARSTVCVPMVKDEALVGAIFIYRTEVRPFTDKQVDLVKNFAAQAVIAIENTRLLKELRERTDDLSESLQQQTATADVLKVISRSAFDLDVVLNSLTKSAVELCNSTYGAISLYRDGVLVFMAQTGCTPEFAELLWSHPAQLDRKSVTGRTGLLRTVVQVPDVTQDEDYDYHGGEIVGNYRSATGVPLLRNGELEGVFTLMRREPGNFTPRQVELVQTFADQAVIAIENVRLFDEVQARTKELAASLEELRSAQDRLVQTEKLASLGQLTAGIAHEIKNPLNFVNNFSALSAELTDELNDVLKSASLADKIREEVDELTGLLKDNLQKVVQHGRRADSIVKNMLLHSREGSGEHRPADINALLDESLNLAYHGARAEKPQFNVTLQRDFDEMAGMIELFPQEITRVFLNLIANGFYAVTKRKTENGGSGFEPALVATTRNLGDTVEICIRDNGTGIPAEVKEKMFNPFFTTKPAGEGTGLGLSMSHDIIVKQHGGTIDVATEPGQFTEFRIVLPRTSNPANKSKS
jgi:two-component system, NtrC family, sensor kinase